MMKMKTTVRINRCICAGVAGATVGMYFGVIGQLIAIFAFIMLAIYYSRNYELEEAITLTGDEDHYELMQYIGCKVSKVSRKPFKSGKKVNTIKGISCHPHLEKYAFTFEEDKSIVETNRCMVIGY